MHYNGKTKDHGLPHDPFKALVTPRPIGWISSVSVDGVVNLAPYSFFNAICDTPYLVAFSGQIGKHSKRNAQSHGEFVCNIVPKIMQDAMNASSAAVPADVSEFDVAKLDKVPSTYVDVPRVAGIPAALECKYVETVALKGADGAGAGYELVIGEVVGVYIDDDVIDENGIVNILKFEPLARLGYRDYAAVTETFQLKRPGD